MMLYVILYFYNQGEVKYYEMIHKQTDEQTFTSTLPANSTHFVIGNLQPNSEFSFILTYNNGPYNMSSETVYVKTEDGGKLNFRNFFQ